MMKFKINWSGWLADKDLDPDRDWQWLLSAWFVAVVIIFLAGGASSLLLFRERVEKLGEINASSTTPALKRSEVEAVAKMIDERATTFEQLKSAPLNLVDPSL